MPTRRAFVLTIAAALAAPAYGETDGLPVVASFSIIGDFVRQVGADRVAVTTLVGPDGDAHVYQPTPADGRKIAQAKLIFVNGLGFEGWLERLVAAAKSKGTIVTLGKGIAARPGEEGTDPHAWQDVANAKIYVTEIRDALAAADPAGAEAYQANAAAYLARLDVLDAEIVKALDALPKERRRVVSTHDAFGYFSARYGVAFIAPQGVSTEAEASARDIAHIINSVKQHKVGAVFLENIADPRLAKRIAAETGAKIGGTLYSDALSGPEGGGANYIDMMRHNVRELTKALAP
ncbi:zinc ABC transporter substrate-binding protein [Methylocystis sp. MJC1]|uniref:metal ABC transporter solute-binding protein, Zn/Mn family n=1 Tax=Methylocystis sp. MJC1 TaxID=2654282 RepID=UPI0013ED50A3|nr:zinc ABC transporter substrate-binding protein [Methylocystis sp. MJC1]KAF2989772.1 Manganese-binding lipoprotein MntA [Methylocystis sp. MJC1]MBU6526340.1 zinc ABC transporter substrate-binding protein [Methylocystis sp. MJC1]UZX12791.1 zinc ABC transporter substrate-binding protein [Methylocystis sp. MJC1]